MSRLRSGVLTEPSLSPQKQLRVLQGGKGERLRDEIASALSRRIEGEIRFDYGSRALYATDLSIYRQVPIGVVIPRTIQDVVETVAVCRDFGVPILGRGCGTSLAGQTCNVAVVIDFSKYLHNLIELNPGQRWARVQPGIIRDDLDHAAREYGLTFAPDPATHTYCTLGGMIGNNSCGVHSVMAGKTAENTEELEILTYDGLRMTVGATSEEELQSIIARGGRRGEIYAGLRDLRDRYAKLIRNRYPRIPRRVSGYNLDELLPEKGFNVARALVGSESTCVLVLSARMCLLHNPPARALLVIGYPDIFQLADETAWVREFGPIALEGLQESVIRNLERKGAKHPGSKLLPTGDAWLLAEFGADEKSEALERARNTMEKLRKQGTKSSGMHLLEDEEQQELMWKLREGGVGASRVPGVEDSWPGWEDAAVAPEKLGPYLRDFYKLCAKYNYRFTIYGHFGDGCVHTRIAFDLKTRSGIKTFRSFMEHAADLVVHHGGSLSGEHGDGQARGELLEKMYGRELIRAFHEFKALWDPEWKMNPGKIIDAYPLDSNIRVADFRPGRIKTHFQFPDDHGNFAEATERCFGVGKCRAMDGATMCPSFHVLRDEMHTTRGRAHLLFEMLRGDPVRKGWRDERVKESLDFCLSCKGCKSDCPVNVDMATYKAEFLSHYWDGRVRPAAAYAFGFIDKWAELASMSPGLVNLLTQIPGLRDLSKRLIGVAPQRELPAFASETLQAWFHRRTRERAESGDVILWPDTFNNFFHPEVGKAAVNVLEKMGLRVQMPRQHLCCGRPLYDFGLLDDAKDYLRRVLKVMAPAISAETPIIVLEPSCASVFRDEMLNLLPNDERAGRFSKQVVQLGEFLEQRRSHFEYPQLLRKAVVHGHCHQKSVLNAQPMESVLKKAGISVEKLDSGCCGMAGSFGFEQEKYDVSIGCGERVLLPAVRKAGHSELVVANGFSCREQIRQCTDRHALHLAQVLELAFAQEQSTVPHIFPEANYVGERNADVRRSMMTSVAGLTALAGSAAIAWALIGQRKPRNRTDKRAQTV